MLPVQHCQMCLHSLVGTACVWVLLGAELDLQGDCHYVMRREAAVTVTSQLELAELCL